MPGKPVDNSEARRRASTPGTYDDAGVSLIDRHERNIRAGFFRDPAQSEAVAALAGLAQQLTDRPAAAGGWGQRWRRWMGQDAHLEPVRGVYLVGGVGRGKTYLMDLFFSSLPFADKRRQHFHRFMQNVHARLADLDGVRNPLEQVATDIAAEARVICFDEFFVSDIADAMLLGTLFKLLFRRGVTLVATSNVAPDDLYRDGLQRSRFIPAITLIKTHTRIVHVDGAVDYRLRVLESADIYHSPADDEAEANLARYFDAIAPDPGETGTGLRIAGRTIPARRRADGIIWFNFHDLIDRPTGPADFIEIARCFQTVLISGVRQFNTDNEDAARRFVTLIDELYDRHVKLIVSAEAPLADLYTGRRLRLEFQRTASRLREMQGHDYLSLAHRP